MEVLRELFGEFSYIFWNSRDYYVIQIQKKYKDERLQLGERKLCRVSCIFFSGGVKMNDFYGLEGNWL